MKSHFRLKEEANRTIEANRRASLEPTQKEKITLEKGDLPALLIAALLNFVLPVMLVLSLICLIAYLFFVRF